ncbi:bifunctional riboflavin kinase/FAD synthetase [Psychroflexus maritimus]|uniref:Riboflavin biosynthesis protein n=1 Tax=Psychroflexus maritimus TaxID=2714865 RepID=A0A967AGC7_9FLAO|nr:bifunctional riboflavin kinase/FAD synthetase [Psychroflexus maritimus]NGZ90001.1 bifunctional riboflavin kinase/FAD synthetase [Psychroflexus maritimus]
MKVFNNVNNFKTSQPTVVTIGTFDGVHIGHRKIINQLLEVSKEGYLSTLLTFFPHPRMVLQQSNDLKLIHTIKERQEELAKTGLENLVIQAFTKEFSRLTARAYVEEILVKGLQAKKVIIGYDHRFGRNRTADIKDLHKFGNEFGFEVEEISKQDIEDVAVSSTKIRKAILAGNISLANQYMNAQFSLEGKVVKGKGLGKDFGFATANLKIEQTYKIIPAHGVYVVKGEINSKLYYGMMNIGVNPTLGENKQSLEVHFFDFNQDIYGEKIKVNLLKKIRNEKKFNGVDELIKAMKKDKEFVINFINDESN